MLVLLDMIARLLVVIGAINWGLVGVLKFDLVKSLGNMTSPMLATAIYILVGLAGLWFLFSRDFYLPFLGMTAMPCGSMGETVPSGASVSISVKVKPNSMVLYWAAEENEKVRENPWVAYDKASNSGLVKSDADGVAVLKIRPPAAYKVPGRVLKPHVHYRVCDKSMMMGRVHTAYV